MGSPDLRRPRARGRSSVRNRPAVQTAWVYPLLLAFAVSGCSLMPLGLSPDVPSAAAQPAPVPMPKAATPASHVPASSSSASPEASHSALTSDEIQTQAHMGGGMLGAPNSAKLFRKTAKMGFEMVEFDVQITSDGIAVINHSDTVMDMPGRPCNRDGLRIHRATYSSVKAVRCAGEPLPTLSEVLSIYKPTQVRLNVEIKAWDNHFTQPTASLRGYTQRIIRQLDDAGFTGRYIISCFDWRVLIQTIRRIHPDMYVIALERSSKMMQPRTRMYQAVRDAAAAGANSFEMDLPFAQESLLALIRAHRMDPQLWYANTPAEVRFAIANGVNPISSDDPVMARQVIKTLEGGPLTQKPETHGVRSIRVVNQIIDKGATVSARVIGSQRLIPLRAQRMLSAAVLEVTISGGGNGTVSLRARNSDKDSAEHLDIPDGTKTYLVKVSPGDLGLVDVTATARATVRVALTGFETAIYRAAA